MVTRDSLVLLLGILGSLVAYLVTAATPPTAWSYAEWLQFTAVLIGIVLAWLRSSPLASSTTPLKDSVDALGGLVKVYDRKDVV